MAQQSSEIGRRGKLATSIMSNGRIPSIIRHLTSWVSYRGAPGISASEVDKLLAERASPDNGLGCIVHFLLGRSPHLTVRLAEEVLYFVDNLSLVDRYNIVLMTLSALAASEEAPESLTTIIRQCLSELRASVRDPLLNRLCVIWGCAPEAPPSQSPLAARYQAMLKADTTGSYSDVINLAEADPTMSAHVEAVQLCVRSAAALEQKWEVPKRSDGNPLIQEIAGDLYEVAIFSQEGVEARIRLEKLVLDFSQASWAASLAAIFLRQASDERVWPGTEQQTFHGL